MELRQGDHGNSLYFRDSQFNQPRTVSRSTRTTAWNDFSDQHLRDWSGSGTLDQGRRLNLQEAGTKHAELVTGAWREIEKTRELTFLRWKPLRDSGRFDTCHGMSGTMNVVTYFWEGRTDWSMLYSCCCRYYLGCRRLGF